MKIKQSERGLYEAGFDDDLSPETLHQLINLFPDPEEVTQLLFELRESDSLTDMKRGELYPEVIGSVTRLRRTIARSYDIGMIQAQPNFSCNGCIDTFLSYIQQLELTDSRRNGFLVATPTYFRYYHKAEALRMRLLGVPLGADYAFPLEEILDRVRKESPSCLFLVTPNNPTGIPIPDDYLFEVLEGVPDDLNVAIDRTCVNIEAEVSSKSLLKRFPDRRIAIFHSFSKYFGMSHLRIGFTLFSNVELAAEVDRYLPFGLNLEAALRATYILATEGELRPSARILSFIKENRASMEEFLARNNGYGCSDFKSNYAVLTLPPDLPSVEFHRRLLERGISVMPGHELPRPETNTARIHTGGPPVFMHRMLETIESWH
jgi:histidinol-phosphate/aromatic aminotransferase/cobyric acid decarboxylase-like protein